MSPSPKRSIGTTCFAVSGAGTNRVRSDFGNERINANTFSSIMPGTSQPSGSGATWFKASIGTRASRRPAANRAEQYVAGAMAFLHRLQFHVLRAIACACARACPR